MKSEGFWKGYFKDVFQRSNYFGRKSIRRTEVKVRLIKLTKQKSAGKDEVTGKNGKGCGWAGSESCVICTFRVF